MLHDYFDEVGHDDVSESDEESDENDGNDGLNYYNDEDRGDGGADKDNDGRYNRDNQDVQDVRPIANRTILRVLSKINIHRNQIDQQTIDDVRFIYLIKPELIHILEKPNFYVRKSLIPSLFSNPIVTFHSLRLGT